MKNQRLYYTAPFMCRMLNVSPSGYYAWLKRKPLNHAIEEMKKEMVQSLVKTLSWPIFRLQPVITTRLSREVNLEVIKICRT